MTYRCTDCSYQHKGKFPGGCCPACSSYNITGNPQKDDDQGHSNKKKTWRMPLSIVLWCYLALLIYQKLQS